MPQYLGPPSRLLVRHTFVWPIRITTPLGALATAVLQLFAVLVFCATKTGAAVLCILRRMLNYAPASSDHRRTPPSPQPPLPRPRPR